MKKAIAAAAVALTFGFASAANAAVTVSATSGGAVYSGPTPTFDFDANSPSYTGGAEVGPGTTPGQFAQPLGSTGEYFSVGPSTSSPATIFLNGLGDIASITLLWGSIDTYNTLTLTDSAGTPLGPLYTFTGSQIAALLPTVAAGVQNSPDQNPLVTFTISGLDQSLVRGLYLTSTSNAFELDNITVQSAVPEPATWGMLILGFLGIGTALRRRRKAALALG